MTLKLEKYNNSLLFLPLGGANEIGMNLNLYYYKGKFLVIDLGIGFADKNLPGVDIILPKIKFLEQYKKDIVGMVLTHAHEDHIGGVPYLFEHFDCPIYTTKFTAEVLKTKLAEFDIAMEIPMVIVDSGQDIQIGPFNVEMVGITHSIPEMHGVVIKTEFGNVFHTGDWKLDPDPIVGNTSDEKRLKELGDKGVLALVCDSTNIFNEVHSGSEGELSKSLETLMSANKTGLLVVTTFSSNIARLHSIAAAAAQNGRRIVLLGRSLWRLYNAALNTGYLEGIKPFLTGKQMKQFSRDELVVICTGCQGETLAATNKMANNEHPDVKIEKGDTIIFSSKIIPGNEKKIYALLNIFCKMGIEVLTERDHFVHVSGHPSRAEVSKMYDLLRPKISIPVHGEAMHLHEHCKVALSKGVKYAIEVENGALIDISAENPHKITNVDSGYLAVDGNTIIDATNGILKERKIAGENGVIIVVLMINNRYMLIKKPKILSIGLLDAKNDSELVGFLSGEIFENFTSMKKKDNKSISDSVISFVKKCIKRERGKSPFVVVQIEKS